MAQILDIGFYRFSLLNRGGDRMVIEYANHLAQMGHRVTIHVAVVNTVLTIDPAVSVRMISRGGGKLGFLAYAVCAKLPHDLVIVDIIHLPLLLALRNRVLYFAQADDIEYYEGALPRRAMDVLYRAYFRGGRPAITVDPHLTRIFTSRYGASSCYTVTNGIDLATFFPEPDPGLVASKGEKRALLFLARGDHYRKGYDLALEVFRQLGREIADSLELWVCGERLEEAGGLSVRNFGVVDDARLRQVLSSVDIFFYPSRHEGFGLFPLEAMACGCAVVTTDAVPYARSLSCISTVGIGDVAALKETVSGLVRDGSILAAKKGEGMQLARRYDLTASKDAFARAISGIMEGCAA